MLVAFAQATVVVIALSVFILSVVGVFSPSYILDFARTIWSAGRGMLVAVMIRLVFGLALFFAAPVSRFPDTFRILGLLVVAAALLIPFLGQDRISHLLNWTARQSSLALRLWFTVGIVFGLFAIYAVVIPGY